MTPALKPKGQRPRCLYCGKELRPMFDREHPPIQVETGQTFTYMETVNYSTGEKRETLAKQYRTMTEAEKRQFKKEHPPKFLGYGGFKDNRFCKLNCGYDWAIAHTRPQLT